jgi:hypothetical protein
MSHLSPLHLRTILAGIKHADYSFSRINLTVGCSVSKANLRAHFDASLLHVGHKICSRLSTNNMAVALVVNIEICFVKEVTNITSN